MAAPRSAAPSSRARPAAPRTRTAARPAGAGRPPLTAREAEALRRLLAGNEAFLAAASPRTTGTRGTASPSGAARSAVRTAAGSPRARRTASGAAVRRTAGTPVRRPAGKPVRRTTRAARKARAERRRQAFRRTLRRLRFGVIAAAVPIVLAVLMPMASVHPAPGSADATQLALAAQSRLLSDAGTYRRVEAEADQRRTGLQRARGIEEAARAQLRARQAPVGRTARALYTAGPQQRYAVLDALPVTTTLQRALGGIQAAAAALRQAEQEVARAQAAVDASAAHAAAVLVRTRGDAARLAPEVTATLAGLAPPSAVAQQSRNQQALARWQAYLQQLAQAGVEPPPVAAIADLDRLPDGMSPALDRTGHRIPGVVWEVIGNHPVTVLPAETVAAVSSALSQLGRPYAPGSTGPAGYDCGGLTSASWLLAGYALPGTPQSQWAGGAPVAADDLQVGDLVFSPGGLDVGIYLGGGDVLGASAGSSTVGVRSLIAGSRGVRVTLPGPTQPNAPLIGGFEGYCGAPLAVQNPAWGGFANGRIPGSALCPLGVAAHVLRCDAAAAYRDMSDAFAAAFGTPLCITDSYRPYDAQVEAFDNKPALAAVPGTSNHGWALAVDLCGGINSTGTPQWQWMQANAPRFGFLNPPWARPDGEKPEPWHWEFGNFG